MSGSDAALRGTVGLAGQADAAAINALLLAQYQAAREFRLLRTDMIAWDGRQGAGGVAAAWDQSGRLVATMRAVIAPSVPTAATALGVSVDLPAPYFPAMILSRAATAPGLSRTGINSLLRWHLLRAAVDQGAQAALGLVYEAAPRLTLMREIGYRFDQPAKVWDPEVAPLRPPLLAVLAPDILPTALAVLQQKVAEAVAAWPWQGPEPVLPLLSVGS
jgi:hypothetical protein